MFPVISPDWPAEITLAIVFLCVVVPVVGTLLGKKIDAQNAKADTMRQEIGASAEVSKNTATEVADITKSLTVLSKTVSAIADTQEAHARSLELKYDLVTNELRDTSSKTNRRLNRHERRIDSLTNRVTRLEGRDDHS